MLASVYDRCSKGKLLKVLELFWAAPPATPAQAAPGPTATTYRKVERYFDWRLASAPTTCGTKLDHLPSMESA